MNLTAIKKHISGHTYDPASKVIITLRDYLIDSAREALSLQRADGSLPPGHNGPWFNKDTPVRTTAHWAMSYAYAFEHTGEETFKRAATAACDYLISEKARPAGDVFQCRTDPKAKDSSNGLIGQAWVVEPLLHLGFKFKRERYVDVALDVLKRHPYCDYRHGWFGLDVGGTTRPFCKTINQQIWFAAMVLVAGNFNRELYERAVDFFDSFPRAVQFVLPGIIRHRYVPCFARASRYKQRIARGYAWLWSPLVARANRRRIEELSLGYLSFILYGLALAENSSDVGFLSKRREYATLLRKVLKHALSVLSVGSLCKNRYGWSYNPVGIEIAYALQSFGDIAIDGNVDRLIAVWMNEQFRYHASSTPPFLNRNTTDPVILSARVYEATRLNGHLSIDTGQSYLH